MPVYNLDFSLSTYSRMARPKTARYGTAEEHQARSDRDQVSSSKLLSRLMSSTQYRGSSDTCKGRPGHSIFTGVWSPVRSTHD